MVPRRWTPDYRRDSRRPPLGVLLRPMRMAAGAMTVPKERTGRCPGAKVLLIAAFKGSVEGSD
jgi:hypothetical protein